MRCSISRGRRGPRRGLLWKLLWRNRPGEEKGAEGSRALVCVVGRRWRGLQGEGSRGENWQAAVIHIFPDGKVRMVCTVQYEVFLLFCVSPLR